MMEPRLSSFIFSNINIFSAPPFSPRLCPAVALAKEDPFQLAVEHETQKNASGKPEAFFKTIRVRNLVCSDHVHAAAFAVELHLTICQSEEGVIFTAANTHTWMDFGSALTHDDVAGNNGLSAVFFHAEALAA